MGKREGVFCDFSAIGNLCPYLALGPCALCEKDVCHEAHSFLRDKFIPGATGRGCAIEIIVRVSSTQASGGVPSTTTTITQLNKVEERVLVCIACGTAVYQRISRGGEAARDAFVSAIRATLTAVALKEKEG